MKVLNFLTLLSLLLLSSCVPDFFKVVSNSYAKELCSCLFVVGQEEDYCKNYAKQIVSVSELTISRENKRVLAKGFGHKSSVTFRSKRLGCQID